MPRSERRQASGAYGEPLSRGRDIPAHEKKEYPIDFVVIASSSHRRISLVRHAFPGTPVMAIPVGEGEPDTPHTPKVVNEKLRRGRAEYGELVRTGKLKTGRTAIIAADTQSAPLSINRKDRSILKMQSKPRNPSEVYKVFQELHEATTLGEVPYYTVTSASGVVFEPANRKRRDMVAHPLVSTLYLDPDKIAYYATPEGFAEYESIFNRFYSSDTYTNVGEFAPITLTDMAAGLSIPVLTREGAIIQINQSPRTNTDFENQLRDALSVAAAGIHPVVLDAVVPGASERVGTWPFLQRLTDYSLGENPRSTVLFQAPAPVK